MSGNGTRDRDERSRNEEGANPYVTAGAVAAGLAAVAGGIYWFTKGRQDEKAQQKPSGLQAKQEKPSSVRSNTEPVQDRTDSVSGYLSDLLGRMATPNSSSSSSNSGNYNYSSSADMPQYQSHSRNSPSSNPVLSNLNALLSDIYVRFVQIKQDDFQLHYKVFDRVFQHLHQKMKEVDLYYRKYSSTVQFAGSHYDNLRIKKPDEFDMDIIIDLPLNLNAHPTNPAESDIVIEAKAAGFVQLRMGVQFQKLPMRDGAEWQNNKAAYEWMDDSKYLLRSKFLDWFKGVVSRALNTFECRGYEPLYYVDGVPYAIRKSESGPAMTLIIENRSRGFQLDVDLVPALKFPESRWPVGPAYRRIPAQCARGDWMLVGKPIKNGIVHEQARSWRIALHNQERGLMYNSGNLKQALRLIKKLRDSLGMKKIASYYIKTIFFWEVDRQNNVCFWKKNSPAFLFKHMVGRLHEALVNKKIPYFWNNSNNLIEGVEDKVLFEYAAKLVPLMQILEQPQEYKKVARYLLTPEEFREYNAKFLHI